MGWTWLFLHTKVVIRQFIDTPTEIQKGIKHMDIEGVVDIKNVTNN